MTKDEMLKRVADALTAAGFADAMVSEDGDAVLFNDDDGNPWAAEVETF